MQNPEDTTSAAVGSQLDGRVRPDGDCEVLKCQVDSLRAVLQKVLDTHNREAKAALSYTTALHNYSNSRAERKAYEHAMLAANDAEREARVLLLTLRA